MRVSLPFFVGSTTKGWRRLLHPWIIVGLTILFVFVVRVRLRDMPLERDEGEYAYAGQLILHGIPPYKEAYNMKLPGTYAAYAVMMAVFGQSPSGIHLGLALVNAASIVLVFLLGRKLLDDMAGMAAAIVFALLSLSPSILGLAGHATHFVTLFALGGIWVLLFALEAPPPRKNLQKAKLITAEYAEYAETDSERKRGDSEIGKENSNAPSPYPLPGGEGVAKTSGPSDEGRVTGRDSALRTPHSALFWSGLLFGMGFLMKQHGIFFGIFGGLYLVWTHLEDRILTTDSHGFSRMGKRSAERSTLPRSVPRHSDAPTPRHSLPSLLRSTLIFTAGFLLPYLLTCLVLWCAGAFHQFVFWTISYAAQYASGNPLVSGPGVLRAGLDAVVGANFLLWMLPWAGALVMWWEGRLTEEGRSEKVEGRPKRSHAPTLPRSDTPTLPTTPPIHQSKNPIRRPAPNAPTLQRSNAPIPAARFFLVALFFCSFASVSVGLIFRPHYFITLLPALALFSGVAVSRSVYLLKHDKTIELFLAIPILGLFIIGSLASVIGNGYIWFGDSPASANLDIYGSTLFSEAAKAASYIKANSAKEARIAVLGSEPEIYFDSGRRSATGYIYAYPVMEEQAYAAKMREELIGEIERGRPEYVVYVNDDMSWQAGATSGRRMHDWFQAYWATNLDLVTTMNIDEKHEEMEPTADKKEERGKKYLLILKRKPNLTTRPMSKTHHGGQADPMIGGKR